MNKTDLSWRDGVTVQVDDRTYDVRYVEGDFPATGFSSVTVTVPGLLDALERNPPVVELPPVPDEGGAA